ncbi:MAG: phosphate ABC transporter permease PstA [Alphaproteobacteria bacterium]|jgi:phosphate transport system permease protein|nr:phosphate ABC transporter permease PstA [Alphaproteobacteria bacterium]MDP6590409.1 phosphate ABC transporter permease PstA [Alphaproteobacteria bacterium]MDP6819635.1 phosphate ABC transporter permease PstA [Alphaproteobacteria bacterium]
MTGAGWQVSKHSARRLKKRYRRERWLKALGVLAITVALGVLVLLLGSVIARGYPAFVKTEIALEVNFKAELIDPGQPGGGRYGRIIRNALFAAFPDVRERAERRRLLKLISRGARFELRRMVESDPELVGTVKKVWLTASSDVDMLTKGSLPRDVPQDERRLSDRQLTWLDSLDAAENVRTRFNWQFFFGSDSREPELAGIGGALAGSFWTLAITLILAFPLGVGAAIYLQEFAPKNRLTDFIEVNINNLAAVPSIVFGLLGLAIFIQLFELPRSTAIVGGLTLMLMTLPTIIIATRAALAAVPPSIREAAHGVGASPLQVVTHHVLPLAMPGIMTGTIIGMARALGETAPLLMIGMVAFIVDIPAAPFDSATALPVQIFLWADSPERGFTEKMSAAIIVLLAFLIIMNALAVYLRRRFEIRW